jgi:pheromone shutdown-related protein TraB
MNIQQKNDYTHLISLPQNKELVLLGTAHVSEQSVTQVEDYIRDFEPDKVLIELDSQRYNTLRKDNQFQELDLFKAIRQKQLPFLMAQFVLSFLQRKLAPNQENKPGQEFLRAIEIAEKKGIEVVLIDRNIKTTLLRSWRSLSLWKKIKFFSSLLVWDDAALSSEEIEKLKQNDLLNEYLDQFSQELPELKKTVIDERDTYMTYHIQNNLGTKSLAIIGAGHARGILQQLGQEVPEKAIDELETIPSKSRLSKILPWLLPSAIIALFIWGFTQGNPEKATEAMLSWIVINGTLSALGCLLALAHPLTIISGFIAAPITSLNPTIGAGFVTAIVQTFLQKPKVKDFLELKDSSFSIKNWWRNRITRIFLVFFLSSIGSALGTWIALPFLGQIFS